VDRGWIPASGNSQPGDWRKYDIPGPVSVDGEIPLGQDTPVIAGMSEPTLATGMPGIDFWVYISIDRISKQLPYHVLPIYIDLTPTQGSSTPPIPFRESLDLSEGPHKGYAIQWFGFAALFVVGYPLYVRKQEKQRP
jgi:cytochrome oxidase assembly protein ShyY1